MCLQISIPLDSRTKAAPASLSPDEPVLGVSAINGRRRVVLVVVVVVVGAG